LLGAEPDAIFTDCQCEGQDFLTPSVSFDPNFNAADVKIRAKGVDPKYCWSSASEMGIRHRYNWRKLRSMCGGTIKVMPYDFHCDNLREAAGAMGINLKARGIHAFRMAAAQKGKE